MQSESCTEVLQFLDEQGRADAARLPVLGDPLLLQLLHAMLRARRVDERRLQLQRRGDIGTFAPNKGQEAAQIGAVANLRPDDWFVPSFRELAALLWRGVPISQLLLYDAGYQEGSAVAPGTHDLPIAIPVATQLPHAAGIAYGIKYRGESAVVMAFFGDGATSEGDFHEAMNFAALHTLPLVFVCQNNHWAISMPRARQTRSRTLAQKAQAYDMPGVLVDGNDLFAVYAASAQAVQRARTGAGPTLIECDTYRMEVHTTADDPTRYREQSEVAAWAGRDPIERLLRYARTRGIVDDASIEAFRAQVDTEFKAAWQDTVQRIAQLERAPLALFDHLYAQPTPALAAQRAWLQRYLQRDPLRTGDRPWPS